jgi:transcriptional regulator with XRE-family HTH domain
MRLMSVSDIRGMVNFSIEPPHPPCYRQRRSTEREAGLFLFGQQLCFLPEVSCWPFLVQKNLSSFIVLLVYGYNITRMQAFFKNNGYNLPMDTQIPNLKELRERAGLSMRQLGKLVGEDHSNIRYWERTGKIPRSDVLIGFSKALGVSVDELLGQPQKGIPKLGGHLGEVFRQVAELPRRRQQNVIKVVEALVKQNHEEIEASK